MGMVITNNIAAMNAWTNLNTASNMFNSSMQKLSSGYRINSAADDPAGLVISEGLRAQISDINQGIANSNSAVSMIQTAEGALQEDNNLLSNMGALALDAANTGVNDASAISADQSQIDEAVASLDRIAQNTQFGSKYLLNGQASNLGTVVDSAHLAAVTIGSTAPSGTNLEAVAVTTSATQASLTTVSLTAGIAATTDTIDGVSVTLAATSTVAGAIAELNTAFTANGLNLIAVQNALTNTVTIHTGNATAGTGYGSSQSLTINQDSTGSLLSTGFHAATGTDIAGTIDGLAATGTGLTLTGTTGAFNGTAVTFTTAGNATATYSSAFEVTAGELTFQLGATTTDSLQTSIADMGATSLGTYKRRRNRVGCHQNRRRG